MAWNFSWCLINQQSSHKTTALCWPPHFIPFFFSLFSSWRFLLLAPRPQVLRAGRNRPGKIIFSLRDSQICAVTGTQTRWMVRGKGRWQHPIILCAPLVSAPQLHKMSVPDVAATLQHATTHKKLFYNNRLKLNVETAFTREVVGCESKIAWL